MQFSIYETRINASSFKRWEAPHDSGGYGDKMAQRLSAGFSGGFTPRLVLNRAKRFRAGTRLYRLTEM